MTRARLSKLIRRGISVGLIPVTLGVGIGVGLRVVKPKFATTLLARGCIEVQKHAYDVTGRLIRQSLPTFTFRLHEDQRQQLTDSMGRAVFRGLSPGPYALEELPTQGWELVDRTPSGSIDVPAGDCVGLVSRSRVIPTVKLEGDLRVARGSGPYSDSITAKPGDELLVQAWYYNRENVDSGLYASNLTVQFRPPMARGERQQISVRIFGDNSNVVEDAVTILVPHGYVLTFIPRSATWRHNRGQSDARIDYVTDAISDAVFGRGQILEDAGPCLLCEATVRVRVRVAPA